MKQKTVIAILICLLSYSPLQGQHHYEQVVYRITGDLNRDRIPDLVIVKEDTADRHHPYLLEILFQDAEGHYKKVLSSTKAVLPKFPDGDQRTVAILEHLQIRNGVLIFTNQMIRGNLTHKFRFQDGNFELIGYSSNEAGAGYIGYVDYNLVTGDKIIRKTAYETDKRIGEKRSREKIVPLPKLQDFSPLDYTY